MMRKNSHIIWADLLRVLAIVGVVYRYYCPAYYDTNPLTTNILVSMEDWCVPVFLMLSGMFALPSDKVFRLKKRLIHIVIALCFWGILYGVNFFVIQSHGSYSLLSIVQPLFWKRLPWYHLWFLYLIMGLYLLTPVLRSWLAHASRKNILYFLILCFAFSSVTYVNQFLPAHIHHLLPEMSAFIGYYVLGYYLSSVSICIRSRAILYGLAVLSCLCIILINYYYKVDAHTFNVYENPFTAFMSAGLFVAFQHIIFSERWRKFTVLAELVFGIYLMHDLFIQYVHIQLFDNVLPINILVNALCNFSLCAVLTWLIRKVPFVGKYIT